MSLVESLAVAVKRALFPLEVGPGGAWTPEGYVYSPPPPLRRVQPTRVEAHRVTTLASLARVLEAADEGRTLAGVVVTRDAAMISVIAPDEPELGAITCCVPVSPTFATLLAIAGRPVPYAALAEFLARADVSMEDRTRAILVRLRAAKKIELDQGSAGGSLSVSWSASGAENAALPRLLSFSVPVLDGAKFPALPVFEAPLVLAAAGDSISATVSVSGSRLCDDAAEQLARDLTMDGAALEGLTVVAGALDAQRWAP